MVESRLEWLDSHDPSVLVETNTAASHYVFYSVCGFSCETPGVGELTRLFCFPNVPKARMEGTTDALQSPRHAVLQARSRSFATSYNTLTAKKRRLTGSSLCDAQEDWDGAFDSLIAYVNSLGGHIPYDSVSANPDPRFQEPPFTIRLTGSELLPIDHARICGLLLENGLSRLMPVELRGPDMAQEIRCANGRVEKAV